MTYKINSICYKLYFTKKKINKMPDIKHKISKNKDT